MTNRQVELLARALADDVAQRVLGELERRGILARHRDPSLGEEEKWDSDDKNESSDRTSTAASGASSWSAREARELIASTKAKREALAVIAAVRAELGPGAPGTTEDLIGKYELWMREAKQNRASSIETTVLRLRRFFGPQLLGRDPRGISAARCQARYDELCKEVAVDTHRNLLGQAKTFCAWAVKKRWLQRNPVASIEPIGKKRRGKEQLRLDEARAFAATALAQADAGNDAGAAVLCALVLGMRASEVVGRRVEDVDDAGRLLWITHSKTAAGRRTLQVPRFLRPRLQALTVGKRPQDGLFRSTDRAWIRGLDAPHLRPGRRAAGDLPRPPRDPCDPGHGAGKLDHGRRGVARPRRHRDRDGRLRSARLGRQRLSRAPAHGVAGWENG